MLRSKNIHSKPYISKVSLKAIKRECGDGSLRVIHTRAISPRLVLRTLLLLDVRIPQLRRRFARLVGGYSYSDLKVLDTSFGRLLCTFISYNRVGDGYDCLGDVRARGLMLILCCFLPKFSTLLTPRGRTVLHIGEQQYHKTTFC